MKTPFSTSLISTLRHWFARTRSRRRGIAAPAAHHVELCEPRQLLSATNSSAAESALCEPVTIISSVTTADHTPLIEWNPVEGAAEYEVFVAARGQSSAVFRTHGITATSLEIPVLLDFGDYTVWVSPVKVC